MHKAVVPEADVKTYQTLLQEACSNHVDSFDLFIEHSLPALCASLPRLSIGPPKDVEGEHLTFWFHSLELKTPSKNSKAGDVVRKLYPSDCRLSHTSYVAPLRARIKCRVGDSGPISMEDLDLGLIPIMVRSKRCNLSGASVEELIFRKEDPSEKGGYFIVNGNEKVVRLLIQQKTNYILSLVRTSFENRGALYSKYATQMRCMRKDLTTLTNSLHYCRDGTCFFRFSHEKNEWLIPLVAVCFLLCDCTETHIFHALTGGGTDHYLVERVTLMLQRQQDSQIPVNSQVSARRFMGKRFRHLMRNVPSHYTDERVGSELAKEFFLVHTDDNVEKFETLCLMYLKLMSLTRGKTEPDNCDALSLQDALLPGQLYGSILKEALEEHLHRTKGLFIKLQQKNPGLPLTMHKVKDCMESVRDIDKQMEYFLATGNLRSRTGLDLMQVTGFTLVADKLNAFRYLSHFRSIHRGAFFTELRTTTVRKLLPETWGFLCPVHTPDGTPCGLLNHLAARCETVTRAGNDDSIWSLRDVLRQCPGVVGVDDPDQRVGYSMEEYAWICMDGRPFARVAHDSLDLVVAALRRAKAGEIANVPKDMEIVCISTAWDHLFPGVYLFTGPCRFVRPVLSLCEQGRTEWIGPLEQIFLHIAATTDCLKPMEAGTQTQGTKVGEQIPLNFTHVELAPTEILSFLASMTPFSNHNQSPRNMYQCQMLKQTMGTPCLNQTYRTDNKVYKIQSPQRPLVRTQLYGGASFNDHPPGINAVVAVIAHTGYDMEDAMILNRASLDRGFFHGHVYKQKIVQAFPEKDARHSTTWRFRTFNPEKQKLETFRESKVQMESDGFPAVGSKVARGDVFAVAVSDAGQVKKECWKDDEEAYLEQINLISGGSLPSKSLPAGAQRVSMKFRIGRNPIIGDKFASRHGQKGVVAVTWPQEDMPFAESGMTPDILFNPHGFPSRMTVGMLIESIAGKAVALHGRKCADASTFRKYRGHFTSEDNNEDDPFLAKSTNKSNIDGQLEGAAYFGKALAEQGFQYWGTEQLYNGMTGEMMPVQIFKGLIYYQRLRHMVSDKVQVRAVGKVDPLTKQPIKGRSKHGGIRFGEMERDSLLAHGTSFLLHDRLFRCSDYHVGNVCPECGCLVTAVPSSGSRNIQVGTSSGLRLLAWECRPCSAKLKRKVVCHRVAIPYVFRYLTCEMAAMNINFRLQLRKPEKAVVPSWVPITDA